MYKTALEDRVILEADDTSSRIFNTDETGMGTNPNKRQLFFKKGAKNVYLQIPNEDKSMYAILICSSAEMEQALILSLFTKARTSTIHGQKMDLKTLFLRVQRVVG